jgi:hypothetical protein
MCVLCVGIGKVLCGCVGVWVWRGGPQLNKFQAIYDNCTLGLSFCHTHAWLLPAVVFGRIVSWSVHGFTIGFVNHLVLLVQRNTAATRLADQDKAAENLAGVMVRFQRWFWQDVGFFYKELPHLLLWQQPLFSEHQEAFDYACQLVIAHQENVDRRRAFAQNCTYPLNVMAHTRAAMEESRKRVQIGIAQPVATSQEPSCLSQVNPSVM